MALAPARSLIALLSLAVSTFVFVTTETLPIGLLPQIAGGLGVSSPSIGLLVTAYGLVVVLATIPLTSLTHRWPRRRLLVTLLLTATAATGLSAVAPNYATLLGSRIAALRPGAAATIVTDENVARQHLEAAEAAPWPPSRWPRPR